jgi:hypothetical protein
VYRRNSYGYALEEFTYRTAYPASGVRGAATLRNVKLAKTFSEKRRVVPSYIEP